MLIKNISFAKHFFAVMLSLLLIIPAQAVYAMPAAAAYTTDDFIFSDPVLNTFVGSREGAQLINNLRFTDLPGDVSAQDAIIRSGVYNMIKGDAPQFRPGSHMTIEEALAFALRSAGFETTAIEAAAAELDTLPPGATAADFLSVGYFAMARDLGLITAEQFTEAFDPPAAEDLIMPDGMVIETFRRTDRATREQFAHWLATAVNQQDASALPATGHQAVHGFLDWNYISPEFLQSIERVAQGSVMTGNNNRFRPLDYITRMEAAWAGRALDSIFHNMAGLERNFGTVAAISDAQALTVGYGTLWREIRVRRDDGQVDILRFSVQVGGSPQVGVHDAVVLKNGIVGGLGMLDIGDAIEYIVNPAAETVMYVLVRGALDSRMAMGQLQTVNVEAMTATFTDNYGRAHTFAFAHGLLREGPDGPEFRLGTQWQPLSTMPYGSFFSIELANNMIIEMRFQGEPVIRPEIWGVVIENNPMLGYLVIFDAQGHERTFNYNAHELTVQFIEHFDMRDTIGGIHALFPEVFLNPRIADMSAIRPGHVVTFRTDPADPQMIIYINGSTNYTTFYGQILNITTIGNVNTILFQFENGFTSMFTLPADARIRQRGVSVNAASIAPGTWARLLVNMAIIGPGEIMESIVTVDLEVEEARSVTSIWVGQLNGINRIQNQMILQNASEFTLLTGPLAFRNVIQFNIANPQIEYFYYGDPVSLGFVNEFVRRQAGSSFAVVALENIHGGERVASANFIGSRHEPLHPDTVVAVDGHGGFHIGSIDGLITTNEGTIVVRNGRLVDGRQIMPHDHVRVALYRENRASIVVVESAPSFSGVQIARARVQSVDQGRSFRVQSMALFDGQQWTFTPIERLYTVDHSTLFLIGGNVMNINDFVSFTPEAGFDNAVNVFDQVFNIVVDGARATHVTDAPYATQSIRGIIYHIDGDTIYLRDTHVRNQVTGAWTITSNISATSNVSILNNSVIVDRDQVVGIQSLRPGQQVRIMTTALPAAVPGMSVNGYIVLVER